MSTWDLSPDTPQRSGHGEWFLPRRFSVQGSGSRVQGSGLRVQVQGSGFRVQGSGFRIQDTGFVSARTRSSTCRGTSLIRNSTPLGPCSRTMPRALWWPWWWGLFHMSEVPLHSPTRTTVLLEEHCPEALERVRVRECVRKRERGRHRERGSEREGNTQRERVCVFVCVLGVGGTLLIPALRTSARIRLSLNPKSCTLNSQTTNPKP